MLRSMIMKLAKSKIAISLMVILLLAIMVGGNFQTLTIGTISPIGSNYYIDGDKVCHSLSHIELNANEYITGWKASDGSYLSEYISVEDAPIFVDFRVADQPLWLTKGEIDSEYYYEYWVDGTIRHISPILTGKVNLVDSADGYDTNHETWQFAKPPAYQLTGDEDGVLTVKLYANIEVSDDPYLTTRTNTYEKQFMGEYSANLKSGNAYVYFEEDIVEAGTEIDIPVVTHSSGGAGFDLRIIGPDHTGNEVIDLGTVPDDFNGDVQADIPEDWFLLSGDNEAIVEIINGKFRGTQDAIWVNDNVQLAPSGGGSPITPPTDPDNPEDPVPVIPGDPTGTIQNVDTTQITGSTVTLDLKGIPNAESGSPIDYFRIYVWYGTPWQMPGVDQVEQYIVLKHDENADANGEATYQFTIPGNRPGQITINVRAVDDLGRGAESEDYTFNAVNPGDTPTPADSSPPLVWTWGLAVILLLALAIAIPIVMLYYIKSMAWKIKIQIIAWSEFFIAIMIILFGFGVI